MLLHVPGCLALPGKAPDTPLQISSLNVTWQIGSRTWQQLHDLRCSLQGWPTCISDTLPVMVVDQE